ncbi:hypothetical protein LMIY3S_05085 [Labrys miyagiensis]
MPSYREKKWQAAIDLVMPVLRLGSPTYLADIRTAAVANGIAEAVAGRDTPALFDWLVSITELQGISDYAATVFGDRYGRACWDDFIGSSMAGRHCPRLRSYWHFHGCNFRKAAGTCAEPEHLHACPVARLPSRNGRLAQNAASLFLFMRDICDGDFVGWIDERLARADIRQPPPIIRASTLREAMLGPLRNVYGVSDKVLSMALAELLLGADPHRTLWVEAGAGMIAVDSLVHNFFHRTGILRRLGCEHAYGPACYGAGGCCGVVEALAARIDARTYDRSYPAYFPRWLQTAIWSFCAQGGYDICNGNKIDDRHRCRDRQCPLYERCDRIPLK